MREIVIGNSYYDYAMYVDENGHLCHWYFLPKGVERKPEKRCVNVMYPYEVTLAVDFEGRLDPNVGNRQLRYSTSHDLIFEEYLKKGSQHIIRLSNGEKNAEVELVFEVYQSSPAIHRYTRVRNCGTKEIVLNHVSSYILGNFPYFGENEDLTLHTYSSAWAFEGEERIATFQELDLCEGSRTGYTIENNSAYATIRHFPCFIIEEKKAALFWGAQIENNGQWRMEVGTGDVENPKWFYMQGGMLDFANSQWYKKLRAGEVYETPKASLTVATDSIDTIYNHFHMHQKKILMKQSETDKELPTVFNDWQALAGDTSEERIVAQLDRLKEIGIEVYVTDAGWFTDPGQDWYEYVGCWDYSRIRFPNGLAPVSKAIVDRGMIPGIWCEIEMAGPYSPIYNEEDMFLKVYGRCITQGGRRFLDFSKEKVRDYATGVFTSLYNDGFRYIKVDYNADCAPGCDGDDSLAENLNQKRLAYGTWVTQIQKKYPDLIIEHCSSGGLKLDYFNLARASVASITDQESHLYTGAILYNVSKHVHPVQCGNWSRIASNFDRKTAEFTLTNSMMGRMCISGVVSECSAEVNEAMKEAVSFYKKYRFIIQEPVIHYHTPSKYITDKDNLKIMEYDTTNGKYALVYISTHNCAGNYSFVPYITDAEIVDCYPNLEGIRTTDSKIDICIPANELFGKILVLRGGTTMKSKWKLGFSSAVNLTSGAWKNGELPEGFDYVELAAWYHPQENDNIRAKCLRTFQEEYELACRQNLKVWSVHLPYGGGLDLTVEDDRSDEIFENFIYYVNHAIPVVPACFVVHVFTLEPFEPEDRDAVVRQTNKNIRRLAEYIASKGSVLAVEALPRTNLGNTVGECLQLIEGTKAEICLDVNHLTKETHREFFQTAYKHVKTVHLSDYEFADEKHWVPGEGTLDWKELLALFDEYGYKGPLMFEVKHHKSGAPVFLRDIREEFYKAIGEERC